MNKSSLRWYYGGFVGIIAAILAFQLIWLPAPLVMLRQLEWIAIVDWLYYSVLFIPGCWLIGAWQTLRKLRSSDSASALRQWYGSLAGLPALLIMLGSFLLIVLLLKPFQNLVIVVIVLIILLLLIGVELFRNKLRGKKIVMKLVGYSSAILILLCPTGYQVTYPAMTMNMSHYAQFAAPDTVEGQGGWIDGVLVFERPAFPIDWLYTKLLPQVELRKQAVNEPGIRETYSQVAQMKKDANQLAAAMAWEYAGKGEAIVFDGVSVVAVVAESPADGVMFAGDVIVSLNQRTISNRQDLQQYMSGYVKPGDQVEIEMRRAEQTMMVELTASAASDDELRPILGIVIQDAYHLQLEQQLELASYLLHAGGPSHGAMLTLALLDQLTAGDITGGLHIAGTGTIEVDGSVGMVGGIPQKAYAVSRTAADVFFVPAASVESAITAAPGLNIVGVDTFSDIITWLEQHASQGVQ